MRDRHTNDFAGNYPRTNDIVKTFETPPRYGMVRDTETVNCIRDGKEIELIGVVVELIEPVHQDHVDYFLDADRCRFV